MYFAFKLKLKMKLVPDTQFNWRFKLNLEKTLIIF